MNSCRDDYASIIDLAGEAIVELLRRYCIETVPATAYAATEVRQGLLQSDPVSRRISILVNPNDPDDLSNRPMWSDGLAGIDEDRTWAVTTYEIGGGERWWRRYAIDINVYLIRTQEERPTAREIGLWVFGRVQQAIQENPGMDVTDTFCEHAFGVFVDRVVPVEQGGPPSSHIWRGKIYVKVLTEKP